MRIEAGRRFYREGFRQVGPARVWPPPVVEAGGASGGDEAGRALESLWPDIVEKVLAGSCHWPEAGAAGRGSVALIPGDDLGLSFAIVARRYRHGGLLRRWRSDLFFSPERFLNELEVHTRAWAVGLAVPEPLGVIAVPPVSGRPGWQGFYLSRRVEGVVGLAEYLARAGEPARLRLAQRLGAELRFLHRAGVFHADLQVGNILVSRDGLPFIIDFDRSRLYPEPLSENRRRANLYRFARSLAKFRARGGRFGRREAIAFLQAYEPDAEAYRLLFMAFGRGLAWRRLLYRLGWWLNRS